MSHFSILSHDYPTPHWDLFLEAGDVLCSWRLLAPLAAGVVVPAQPTGDHRLLYLNYEGPLTGDRESVTRVDGGTFIWETDSLEHVVVRIVGTRFAGRLILVSKPDGWTCRFLPEECQRPGPGINLPPTWDVRRNDSPAFPDPS